MTSLSCRRRHAPAEALTWAREAAARGEAISIALVGNATNQLVVPVAGRFEDAVCQALPFQNWLLLERWIVRLTLATPESVSAAVPQILPVVAWRDRATSPYR